jgi:16S rRNA G1207 methylase RsmC
MSVPDGIVLAADLLHSDFSAYTPFDVIFCVPPFYDAYTEGTGFMDAFAARAKQMLSADGMLIIVANRVLKFDQLLKHIYTDVEVIDDGGNFQMMIAQ